MVKHLKKLNVTYAVIFTTLIIFGFYKNGIYLYSKNLVGKALMFKPIIIVGMSMMGCMVSIIIRHKRKRKPIKELKFDLTLIFESIVLASILPIKSSPIIVFICSFFLPFLKKFKINEVALMYLFIEGFNNIFDLNIFSNAYESSKIFTESTKSYLLGFNPGGINSSSSIIILIGLLLLSRNKLYKKEAAFSSILVYFILNLAYGTINSNYGFLIPNMLGHNTLFTFVFILTNKNSSCYTSKGLITSGILVAILTFIFSFFIPNSAPIVSVLIISLFRNILDRIFIIK